MIDQLALFMLVTGVAGFSLAFAALWREAGEFPIFDIVSGILCAVLFLTSLFIGPFSIVGAGVVWLFVTSCSNAPKKHGPGIFERSFIWAPNDEAAND